MHQISRGRLRSRFEHTQSHCVFLWSTNGRVTAQLTESGGDCFSCFLCLPLVCAVSVLHDICLVAQGVQLVKEYTHWVQSVVTSCLCLVFDSATHRRSGWTPRRVISQTPYQSDARTRATSWADWGGENCTGWCNEICVRGRGGCVRGRGRSACVDVARISLTEGGRTGWVDSMRLFLLQRDEGGHQVQRNYLDWCGTQPHDDAGVLVQGCERGHTRTSSKVWTTSWRKTKIFTTRWSTTTWSQMSRSQQTTPRSQRWKQTFLRKVQGWHNSQTRLTCWGMTASKSQSSDATATEEKQLASWATKAQKRTLTTTQIDVHVAPRNTRRAFMDFSRAKTCSTARWRCRASMSRSMSVRAVRRWVFWSSFLRRCAATLCLFKVQNWNTRRRLMNWVTKNEEIAASTQQHKEKSPEAKETKLSSDRNTAELARNQEFPGSRRHLLRISTLLIRCETSVTLSGWSSFRQLLRPVRFTRRIGQMPCWRWRSKAVAQKTSFADVEESKSRLIWEL